MARDTPATRAARAAGIAFTLHEYAYDGTVDRVGLAAAEALGEPPSVVWKTLMLLADAKPVCAVLPSDREVSLKALAAAAGAKAAKMMPVAQAERATGYKVGGISPFGQRKPAPTFVEAAALDLPALYVNGGQRGLQMRLTPADLISALQATLAAFAV